MNSLTTIVNRETLEEWCRNLPECRTFLENFFSSCQPYTWGINFLNYVRDIEIQTLVEPHWRPYENRLMKAFVEITGDERNLFAD